MKYASKDYLVNELAKFYGISGDTIRHYDRKGLLPSKKNEENNYRIYDRDDFMAMDYILRLRKMDTSLEDINKIVNQFSYEEIEDFFATRDEEIQRQIKELVKVQTMISDYRYTLQQAREGCKEIRIRSNPAIICKKISSTAHETMAAFDNMPQSLLPFITITIPGHDFMTEDSPTILLDAEVRATISELMFTAIDRRNIHKSADFPAEEFEIIPEGRCLYFAENLVMHSDYSVMYRMMQYIREHDLEPKSPPLIRIINTQIQNYTDFYEYIVPLK